VRPRKTGGGAFDPAGRPVYFAAGAHLKGTAGGNPPAHVLVAVNELPSTAAEESNLIPHLDAGRKVLLDSGIFWLTNEHKRAHGCSMNEALALPPEQIDGFGKLRDRYLELTTRHGDRLWGYIELDQGGAENKRRTRSTLEAAGLAPIPVYHPLNDGWDYFDELASSYDRICFGNIVQASQQARARLLHTLWERHRAYPDLWVHVLGLTASELCLSCPFESCDSSSWARMLRWNNTRTETALLARTGPLGERFAYHQGGHLPGAAHADSVQMCLDAFAATNRVWKHATERLSDLGGPHLPAERPVTR